MTALIDAIKDGTVTCIGTDHAPHTAEEKEKGAAGMVGLETAFGVCYTKLCREQRLPLEMLSFLMSAGPAAVLGLADRKGMLEPGYDATSCWWTLTTCTRSTPTSCTARARTAPTTAHCCTEKW